MEEFKKFKEILEVDEKHILLSKATGRILNIELFHKTLLEITLNNNVPEKIVA